MYKIADTINNLGIISPKESQEISEIIENNSQDYIEVDYKRLCYVN